MNVVRLCRGRRSYFTTHEAEERLHNKRLYHEQKLELRQSRIKARLIIEEAVDLVRFWDLLGSHACIQEMSSHREKGREGVLAVDFHPSLPVMASAGADGVIKLHAST